MIINKSGITIRMSVDDMRVMGRATQGVRLINLKNDDIIAAVAKVEISDDDEVIDDSQENAINEDNKTESSDVNVESESIENSNDSNDEIPQNNNDEENNVNLN